LIIKNTPRICNQTGAVAFFLEAKLQKRGGSLQSMVGGRFYRGGRRLSQGGELQEEGGLKYLQELILFSKIHLLPEPVSSEKIRGREKEKKHQGKINSSRNLKGGRKGLGKKCPGREGL